MTIVNLAIALVAANQAPIPGVEAVIEVDAPAATVWEAYTSAEVMEQWQVGRTDGVDLHIGATFRTSYDAESGLDDATTIETELLAFDPGRMMATRTLRAPADFPFPDAIHDAWSVLYIDPIDEGTTRVTIRMFGFSDSEESRAMREFFEWGNPYELEKLVEFLETR